ncbi:transketolase-like protein 2 isoform X3 [Bacillus rossius redtenbacheri]
MAYVGKYYDKSDYRVYCLVGDGESAEGSIWEALHFASFYRLDNLCVVFDINRLGQSQPTALQHDIATYEKRVDAFGFHAITADGHDIPELIKAFHDASQVKGKPTAILAKTYKGKNFPGVEDKENWHGKPLGANSSSTLEYLRTLAKKERKDLNLSISEPAGSVPTVNIANIKLSSPPEYKPDDSVATRLAYGTALAKLARSNARVIALDGDTKNSTFADKIKQVSADNYIECFIAEQNLVGVAMGAACRDRTVAFVSTFAAFFTRAFDQIRMGAISQTNVNFVGSHCGISIGEDGPSQMGLEDIALFRTVPGATVFYPSDAVSCERAVELAANTKGICYIRTSRPNTSILYKNSEVFEVGKAKVVKHSADDKVLIVGGGVTLHEAVSASKLLAAKGVHARVLDPFTIKPLDAAGIIRNAKEAGHKIVTVEDHYPEGGLGEAVLSAVASEKNIVVKKLAVKEIARSGPPAALLDMFGISASAIVKAVEELLR